MENSMENFSRTKMNKIFGYAFNFATNEILYKESYQPGMTQRWLDRL